MTFRVKGTILAFHPFPFLPLDHGFIIAFFAVPLTCWCKRCLHSVFLAHRDSDQGYCCFRVKTSVLFQNGCLLPAVTSFSRIWNEPFPCAQKSFRGYLLTVASDEAQSAERTGQNKHKWQPTRLFPLPCEQCGEGCSAGCSVGLNIPLCSASMHQKTVELAQMYVTTVVSDVSWLSLYRH